MKSLSDEFIRLVSLARKRGFLRHSCPNCAQFMVVARSGKTCINCGTQG